MRILVRYRPLYQPPAPWLRAACLVGGWLAFFGAILLCGSLWYAIVWLLFAAFPNR